MPAPRFLMTPSLYRRRYAPHRSAPRRSTYLLRELVEHADHAAVLGDSDDGGREEVVAVHVSGRDGVHQALVQVWGYDFEVLAVLEPAGLIEAVRGVLTPFFSPPLTPPP